MPDDAVDVLIAEGLRLEAERRQAEAASRAETARRYDAGDARPRRLHSIPGGKSEEQEPSEPFGLHPVHILDQKLIPHRQWIYGTQLIRGFVTLLVAPGGTGKSSLLLATCLSIATGRSLLGSRIFQACNTALLNLEDPQDEIDRRLTALALRYDISNDALGGRFFVSPPDRGIRIAANGDDGFSVVHPDEQRIKENVLAEKIGVLAVDPFAESHTLEENSNPQMIQAAAAWRRVARECNCAVILTHHVRKGLVDSIEAARGAKALTDSARVGLLLSTMTKEEGEALGISESDRLQYVRLDDAKANMAPRAPSATWFRLSNVTLNNSNAIYASGDQVVVVESWEPPSVWKTMSTDQANQVLDQISAGLPGGERYTDSRRGGGERWAGSLLVGALGITEKQAADMLQTWIKNGVLVKETYHNADRKDRIGLRVVDIKRPGGIYG